MHVGIKLENIKQKYLDNEKERDYGLHKISEHVNKRKKGKKSKA